MSSDQPKIGEEAELSWGLLSQNTVRADEGCEEEGNHGPRRKQASLSQPCIPPFHQPSSQPTFLPGRCPGLSSPGWWEQSSVWRSSVKVKIKGIIKILIVITEQYSFNK